MRIVVVGGYGRMGRWFARFLSNSGHSVWIAGRRSSALRRASRTLNLPMVPPGTRCKWADSAFLAVPPDNVEEVAEDYDGLLGRNCLLVDISSVKAPMMAFLQRSGRPVLSIHPLFGPRARTLKGRTIAVVHPTRLKGRSRVIVECFKRAGATIVHCTPDLHDRVISYTLALPHLLGALYGSSLVKSGLAPKMLAKLGGASFRKMYSLARSVGSESPMVYASIQLADASYQNALREVVITVRRVQQEFTVGKTTTFMKMLDDSSELPFVG